jgi:hypothetical protein
MIWLHIGTFVCTGLVVYQLGHVTQLLFDVLEECKLLKTELGLRGHGEKEGDEHERRSA